MTATFRVAVHANFKDIFECKKQETKKSSVGCAEHVFRIIAGIKEYENPLMVA